MTTGTLVSEHYPGNKLSRALRHSDTRAVQTDLREELANCITHGVGLLLSVIGLVILVWLAVARVEGSHLVGTVIFGATLVLMYTVSTLYHSAKSPRAKRVLRILDHISIYLLIAGTYTPVLLIVFPERLGTTFLIIVWSFALLGTVFKVFFTGRFVLISISLYVLMGWLIVGALDVVISTIAISGLWWLALGGFFYTVGVVFFAWERLPFNHMIWHLFVLGGSICHYLAITFYVINFS